MDAMLTLQQKRLLRVDEAARILSVSRWTVYRWVEAGRLGGTRLGAGSLRIFSDTVAALIDHHCVGGISDSTINPTAGSGQAVQKLIGRRESDNNRVRPRQQAAI